MQVFSGDTRVPKSWLIVATMLDLQNLRELGRLIPSPLVAFSTLQSSSSLKIQDGGYSNMPTLQANNSLVCPFGFEQLF